MECMIKFLFSTLEFFANYSTHTALIETVYNALNPVSYRGIKRDITARVDFSRDGEPGGEMSTDNHILPGVFNGEGSSLFDWVIPHSTSLCDPSSDYGGC
jgi:hypothetical protein